MTRPARLLDRARNWRPALSTEAVCLLAALIFALAFNLTFWSIALKGRTLTSWSTWRFAVGTFVLLTMLHFLPALLLVTRRTVRPLLVALLVVAALAQYFVWKFGVVLDVDMMRNLLQTQASEAREYLSVDLLLWMLGFALLPALILTRVRMREGGTWRRRGLRRIGAVAAAAFVAMLAGNLVFQDLSSQLRNRHELQFSITPLGPIWFASRAAWKESRQAVARHAPADPAWRTLRAGAQRKPLLLVLVVGETARAANFSLLGYERPTNPALAREDVIAFMKTHSCGTATAVSLPCMFSPFGRGQYDEDKIRAHDSVLQVLQHAGLEILWRDNQSGCKGVCDGLRYENVTQRAAASACHAGECFDEVLLQDFHRIVSGSSGDQVIVLHQLGNHGPAYHRRYPAAFRQFQPACESDELGDCTQQQIVNAYDNAILYTDHVLASVIALLRAEQAERDVAMLYVSDHGESLGEQGLYLHGMPYLLAPENQLHVPMIWWLPAATAKVLGVDTGCLKRRAGASASHDNLYHSLLGLLAVQTPRYARERDLIAPCRAPSGTVTASNKSAPALLPAGGTTRPL